MDNKQLTYELIKKIIKDEKNASKIIADFLQQIIEKTYEELEQNLKTKFDEYCNARLTSFQSKQLSVIKKAQLVAIDEKVRVIDRTYSKLINEAITREIENHESQKLREILERYTKIIQSYNHIDLPNIETNLSNITQQLDNINDLLSSQNITKYYEAYLANMFKEYAKKQENKNEPN